MISDDDSSALEWWWCPDTGEPITVCACPECAAWRRKDAAEQRNEAEDDGHKCPLCDGHGAIPNDRNLVVDCPNCDGTGHL